MFSEELKGSRSRKRQEDTKARRRLLKQQQQRKANASTTQTTVTVSGVVNVSNSTSEGTADAASAVLGSASLARPAAPIVYDGSKPTAVANALQQRLLRQELQLQHKSATRIQAFYRAHRSNASLLSEQESLFSQRLHDVATLRTLIYAKTSSEYVPPPATVTSLGQQLLFLTKTIPYKRNSSITSRVMLRGHDGATHLQRMLDHVLLPGIVGADENLDPALSWIASEAGRKRFNNTLRLCFVVATTKATPDDVLETILAFLRTILGAASAKTARSLIIREARLVMLSDVPFESTAFSTIGSPLDIIQILRQHLLFGSGAPIPPDAMRGRDSCFSAKERKQNDALFRLALEAIQVKNAGTERRLLQSRFAAEIFTVPLLTWRLSSTSVATLVKDDTVKSQRTPLFCIILSSFVEQHCIALSAGNIATVLPSADIPLTVCPATNTQSFLANFAQMGRLCPSVNGSEAEKLNYDAAELFFKFLATLLDAVPLGTFSSRDSAVEWISDGKSHHTPIVMSPVVMEQCRLILVDSFVRGLFACAIDNDAFGTEKILREKHEKDLKHERELTEVGSSSTTTLAAKEARIDRNRSFWQSSKWARKLGAGMTQMLSKKQPARHDQQGSGQLMDTSSMSRKLAHGQNIRDRRVTNSLLSHDFTSRENTASRSAFQRGFFFALCRAYGTILSRWGGGGRDDIVKRKKVEEPRKSKATSDEKGDASSWADPSALSLLNALCFSTSIVQTSWALIQSDSKVVADVYSVIDTTKRSVPIRSVRIRPVYAKASKSRQDENDGAVLLFLFVCTLAHTLIITDDIEIHDMDKPIPVHQVRRCIQVLKKLLYRACSLDDTGSIDNDRVDRDTCSNHFGLSLVSSSSKTMRDLYDRSSRRPLCVPKLWIVEDLLDKDIRQCKRASEYEALLVSPVLRICPFLVSFKRRLKLFERIVTTNRVEIQGENSQNPFHPGLKPGIPVRITRGRVLEDGLATLNKLGRNLRQRIAVQYVSETGAQESGVDVGGLFKEFWTDLSHIAFNPSYALFRVTEGAGNCLYPNPSSGQAHGPDHIVLFQFLGRILGKALFEGITIHPRFAHFFLSFIRGDYNFLHMLPDLSTLDPQLYQNLMFLKTFEGDAEDLCLSFTVADDDFGLNKEIPLIPNGADVPVTNSNKQRYIGLVAKHHVCDRVKEQSEAFTRGLWDVIDRSWLQIFNQPELQVLISGATDGKLDVADMRTNTRYTGGFTGLDRNIQRFWRVVSSFNSKQQADLLRFATSCERPPPLGFASMNPPFTIQRVGILRDGDKLPTASTCFNVLKLPTYSSERVLRDRLLYAIEAGAGFELM